MNVNAETSSAVKRPRKWHLIYYFLAAFDLLTISGSLYLNHQLMGIYESSVASNQVWADIQSQFINLGSSASSVNAPGNEVFDNLDVVGERARRDERLKDFSKLVEALKGEITAKLPPAEARQLQGRLKQIYASMDEMVAEADAIFQFFTDNNRDAAGQRMATMDRKYGVVTENVAAATRYVHDRQDEQFKAQLVRAENLRRFEFLIGGLIVLIVLLVTLYGHRIAKEMRRHEEEREQHTRELEIKEQERAATEAKFVKVVDDALDAILTFSDDGLIQSANRAAAMMFGYTAEQLEARHISVLVPDAKDAEHAMSVMKGTQEGGRDDEGSRLEVEGVRRNRERFPLSLGVSELTDEEPKTYVAILRDRTESKEIERMKSEFVSTVSHELRTPITAIQGSLKLINAGVIPDADKQKDMLTIAESNTDRLLTLVNDLLDFEKLQAGRMEFNFTNIDLVSLVEASIETNKPYAEKFGVKLNFQVRDNTAPPVMGDETRLAQVIANLISNAAKFSAEGEEVTITVDRTQGGVSVRVQDKGPGIPEDFRARLFDRFTQVDGSSTKNSPGTGLGLAICKHIIDGHNGIIDVESEVGNGSVFYFVLPDDVPPPQPPANDTKAA